MALRVPDPDDGAILALHAQDGSVDDVDLVVEADALDYADTVSALAEAVASPPALGLRSRVLASAFAERAPGASIDDGRSDPAPRAFARTATDLDALLADLADADWLEPAHPEIGRVRDVVAHLLAIETYVLAQLTERDRTIEQTGDAAHTGDVVHTGDAVHTGHVETGEATIVAVRDLPVGELRRRWKQAADALADAAQAAPADTVVQLHSLPAGIEGAMFMRTFELWAHLDDIARATGRRRPRLDARRLRAMSTALVDALPIAMAVSGHADVTARVRLVTTGPGGGSHDLVLGDATDGPATPAATVIVDVVDLCRLAARRSTLSQLDLRIDGDRAVADALLASVSAFAMD
jgi:uncharacterized protein (TIGR03083 family)